MSETVTFENLTLSQFLRVAHTCGHMTIQTAYGVCLDHRASFDIGCYMTEGPHGPKENPTGYIKVPVEKVPVAKLALLAGTMREYSTTVGDHHWQAAEACESLIKAIAEKKRYQECFRAIYSSCIGEITMGVRMDANHIGELIFEATGLNAEQLTEA